MSVTTVNASSVLSRASRELRRVADEQPVRAPLVPEGRWSIDPVASTVAFSVGNFWVSTVTGEVRDFEGVLTAGADGDIQIQAGLRVASIDTGNRLRDRHLRSGDFLDAEGHPRAELHSRVVRQLPGSRLAIEADLRLHGATRPLTLEARVLEPQGPLGDGPISVIGGGAFDRRTFAIARRRILDAIVGARVAIGFDLCLIQVDGTGRGAS